MKVFEINVNGHRSWVGAANEQSALEFIRFIDESWQEEPDGDYSIVEISENLWDDLRIYDEDGEDGDPFNSWTFREAVDRMKGSESELLAREY